MATEQSSERIYANPDRVFVETKEGTGPEPKAMETAAEALRAAEIEAVDPEPENDSAALDLESMNIDELRGLAKKLDVPNRETITETDELIAAIRESMGA